MFQGYRGILHGGIIASLLDASMTHCLFHHGIQAVTADLQIRFLKPVPCVAPLKLWARIVDSHPPLYKVVSELTHNKHLMATAQAKFMNTTDSQ